MRFKMPVVSLCDRTGNAVRPWARAGYKCYIVDLQHPPGESSVEENIIRVGADVSTYELPGKPSFVFAFPPCTDLAVSGARWFQAKGLLALSDGIRLVAHCAKLCENSDAPYMIENPVSTLATYWRKPDHKFDPCEYAGYLHDPSEEAYTKKTCLWTGGGFIMPEKKPVRPALGSKMHVLPPSEDRANIRAETPKGFSQAVFLANSYKRLLA